MTMTIKEAKELVKDAMTTIVWTKKLMLDYVLLTRIEEKNDLHHLAGIQLTARELILYLNYDAIIKYNLSKENIVQLLLHEYSHVLLGHFFLRLPDSFCDNMAADIEINQEPWIDPNDSFISSYGLTYSKFKFAPSKSREFYYEQLKSKNQKSQKSAFSNSKGSQSKPDNSLTKIKDDGTTIDEHSKFDNNNEAVKQVWKKITESAIEKNRGELSEELIEYIQSKWKTNKSLQQILRRIVGKYYNNSVKETSSRIRPNRRQQLLPGNLERYGAKIVFAIDTSGSMSTKDLEEIYSVIKWISKRTNVTTIQCDASITDVVVDKQIRSGTIGVKGRGGTSFVPVFKFITDKFKDKIDILVYATDLDGEFPTEKPKYPVVWLATSNKKVPFGQIIKL